MFNLTFNLPLWSIMSDGRSFWRTRSEKCSGAGIGCAVSESRCADAGAPSVRGAQLLRALNGGSMKRENRDR